MAKKKYRPKFAQELKKGLRKTGWTIDECCLHWGIARSTWYDWIKTQPKFAEAADMAEVQYNSWFSAVYRDVMCGDRKGNAGLLAFGAKNILGWADKIETHTTHDTQVHLLQIETLPSYEERLLLSQQDDVIEGEIVE